MAAAIAAVVAIASQWSDLGDHTGDLSIGHVALGVLCTVLSLAASCLAWRSTLAGLGDRVPVGIGARIFFLGQLGKYLPGSVWALVGQMELGRRHGLQRNRLATAGVLVLVISLAVALVLGGLAVPALLEGESAAYAWLLLLLLPLAVVLHPPVLTRLVDGALRLARRPLLDAPIPPRTVLEVAGLSILSNGLLGLLVWQLAVDLGGDGWDLVALCIGAYGLAASAGLVVIPLPAGAGVREAVLVAVLAPEIGTAEATLVAIVARLVATACDLAVAGAVALAVRQSSTTLER